MADRSIQSGYGGTFGGLHVQSVEASSTPNAQFDVERTVDGQKVYLTAEGAGVLDASEDKAWTVHVSGHTWDRLKALIAEWSGK